MSSSAPTQPPAAAPPKQQPPDFLVHEEGDSVGVIVVEGVRQGVSVTGWIMAQDRTVAIQTQSNIPIGHKVALVDLAVGDSVIKYGVNIGKVVAPIRKGEHVHVHNLKTRRW